MTTKKFEQLYKTVKTELQAECSNIRYFNKLFFKQMLKATNILWDIDYDDDGELPTEIDIPERITDEDEISDYLSEVTGYCHQGYVLEGK